MPCRSIDSRTALPGEGGGELLERLRASLDPEWIDEALKATGTATIRRRRLPAEQVTGQTGYSVTTAIFSAATTPKPSG